jgi:hypothetical protein
MNGMVVSVWNGNEEHIQRYGGKMHVRSANVQNARGIKRQHRYGKRTKVEKVDEETIRSGHDLSKHHSPANANHWHRVEEWSEVYVD